MKLKTQNFNFLSYQNWGLEKEVKLERTKHLVWRFELLTIHICPRIQTLVLLVCHKTNERLKLVLSAMSQSHSVRWLCLLRTVNAWEMRQLLVADIHISLASKTTLSATDGRQALRGAQGHSWSGVGRVRGTGPLPLSPQKPGKHCPGATAEPI